MERMKALSGWKVKEFVNARGRMRIHSHDWPKTERPNGFPNLSAEYRDSLGWQFALSANEHGRVHGILIGDTFYVIWLDHDHILYPHNEN